MQIKVTAINLKVTVEDFLLFSSPWECVPLAIFYHLSFLRISKVWSMVHHGSFGWVQKFRIKNASWCVHIIFWHVFAVFHQKIVFIIFSFFFFDEVSNFGNRIVTIQKPELVRRNCQWNSMFMRINWLINQLIN